MRFIVRLAVFILVALGLIAGAAGAQANGDASKKMTRLFTSPNQATNSDLASWGDHAFVGYYTGGAGSARYRPAAACGSSTSPTRPRRSW